MFKTLNTTNDIDKLVVMAKEIWTEHFGPIVGSSHVTTIINTMQSRCAIEAQLASGQVYRFILENEIRIGYFAYLVEEEGVYLSKIYLYAQHRGKGYARQVIDFLVEVGQHNNSEQIYLDVLCKNEDAVASYIKMGFVIKAKKDRVFNDELTCVDYHMCKYL